MILYMVTTAFVVCSVNNMTPQLWSVHVHIVFCSVTYTVFYEFFFLQAATLRTVSTHQSKENLTERIEPDTPAVLSAHVHIFDVISETTVFLQVDSLQTSSSHSSEQAKPYESGVAVLQMTVGATLHVMCRIMLTSVTLLR